MEFREKKTGDGSLYRLNNKEPSNDKFGNLYEKQDLFTNTTYHYNYDLSGRITGIVGSNDTSVHYTYDEFNRVEKFIAKVDGNTNTTEYIYGDSSVGSQKDGLIYGVKQNGTKHTLGSFFVLYIII